MHLQHVLGMVHQDLPGVCAVIEKAIHEKRLEENIRCPLDLFSHLVTRYREFLIVTFQRTSYIEDTGATRGTSQALLVFDLLLMALLIQARMKPSIIERPHFDTDYAAIVRNRMAVHGHVYRVSTYSQSQVCKSWAIMAERFLGVDLERDIADLVAFRMVLLRRTAAIVHMSETDAEHEHCRVLDMSSASGSGYVVVHGKRRQCAPRFSVEVMAYYVQTEVLIHIYHTHIKELEATDKAKRQFSASLLRDIIQDHGRGETTTTNVEGDEIEAYSKLFDAWKNALCHHLAIVESAASKDHTAVERLADDIRERVVPPGYRTRFRFDNHLMNVSELGQLEGALYSNEKQYFIRSYRHREMSFFTDEKRHFHDDPMIKPMAGLHMIQQFLLNNAIELLFNQEILFADYELSLILLRTPETVSSKERGYFNVNNIVGMNVSEDTLFEPHREDIWQLPISMRNIQGKPEESMPAVLKIATHFYVYHEARLYSVEDEYEAFSLWVLIIVHKCRCKYVRRGRGKSFDLSFLKHYILQRLDEVPDALLTPSVRAVLVEQLGESSVGRVEDAHMDTTEMQAIMIDNMFEDMEVE